jgi:hypothetical protein
VVRLERQRDRHRGSLGAGRRSFEAFGSNPPEALVNLGICHDDDGDGARALALWRAAQAQGLHLRELAGWIDRKERLLGP